MAVGAAGQPARLRSGWMVAVGALVLTAAYLFCYLGHPALPGNNALHPEGWWGWFDQSKTLRSAQAFAAGDLRPDEHWYPLGYALLGAPFVWVFPAHPFVLVDLAGLLVAYLGFIAFCRRVTVPPVWSAPLFLLSVAADPLLFQQWAIPWNTTPTAALIWLLLAGTAAQWGNEGRPFLLGLLMGLVPTMRPTEIVVIAPCVIVAALVILLRPSPQRLTDFGLLVLGGVLPVLGYGLLHLAIYGPNPTDYMLGSRELGFSAYALVWKAYVLLVEPRVWFGGGQGLIARVPWLALGAAGLIAALLAGRVRALLATVLLLHALLYVSYVDLLPSGLWRYNLTHYWVWTLPGYALLALLLLRDLVRPAVPRRRAVAAGALAVTLLVLCVHINPTPAQESEAFALDFAGPPATFNDAYFGRWRLRDAEGVLPNIAAARGQPMAAGMRVFSVRRRFAGDERIEPDAATPTASFAGPPAARWSMTLRFGRPCWLIGCRIPGQDRMFGG